MCILLFSVVLPGTPRSIEVEVLGYSQIRVQWEAPTENADLVEGYQVHYKKTYGQDFYHSVSKT